MISRAYRSDKTTYITGIGRMESMVLCDGCAARYGKDTDQGIELDDAGCSLCGTLKYGGLLAASKIIWPKEIEPAQIEPEPERSIYEMEPITFDDLDEIRDMIGAYRRKRQVVTIRSRR